MRDALYSNMNDTLATGRCNLLRTLVTIHNYLDSTVGHCSAKVNNTHCGGLLCC